MSKSRRAKRLSGTKAVILNSLQDLAADIQSGNAGVWGGYGGLFGQNAFPPQNSRIDTVFLNTRAQLISNYRWTLNAAYTEYGIVQTLCGQPVDDAFRTGFTIKAKDLTTDQISELEYYIERNQIIRTIKQGFTWARLFGGSGIVINTDQSPDTPLDIRRIKKDSKLEFFAADEWELFPDDINYLLDPFDDDDMTKTYCYYGVTLHRSRVFPIRGKEAPSMLRPRLRGWGMSELERVVRSINSYLKNQNLIFELLDEAKIDVYQMQGFNTAMLTQQGTTAVSNRIQLANSLKNYLNALILDVNDKYDQKQLSFNGLAEILNQIRQGVAADLKMPMTKLFGVSSAGFNSGEDDIENYNSMVESEIRSTAKFIVIQVLELCCQKLFGFIPKNLNIEFKPLRSLSAEQEENKKNSEFNRLVQTMANGLCSVEQFKLGCNNANLLPFLYESMTDESNDNLNKIQVEVKDEKKSIMSRLFGGKKEADKAETAEQASEEGKVKEVDVTSNKFTIPEREKNPLPDKAFPYKSGKTERYVKSGG